MKTWNLGNTTVRNPRRIAPALRVFADDFAGRPFDQSAQLAFRHALAELELLTGEASRGESAAIQGRKFGAAFNQLGLAVALESSPPARLTSAGHALLATAEPEIVFLRQLLKYQLPSPREKAGRTPGFGVHPFWVVVSVSVGLRAEGMSGLTPDECTLFVNTTVRDDDVPAAVLGISAYRDQLSGLRGNVRRRQHFGLSRAKIVQTLYKDELKVRYEALGELFKASQTLNPAAKEELVRAVVRGGKGAKTRRAQELRAVILAAIARGGSFADTYEIVRASLVDMWGGTFKDYGDTTIRYAMLSGLFTLRGRRLELKEDALHLAQRIAREKPTLLPPALYEEQLPDVSIPALALDDERFRAAEARRLRATAARLGKTVSRARAGRREAVLPLPVLPTSPELRPLRAAVSQLRESVFYLAHAESAQLQDVLTYINDVLGNSLPGGHEYRPAFLEWSVWRAFLVLNELKGPISDTRNFDVDEEVMPVHHARSNAPDMVFAFHDDLRLLVCETTLQVGERQAYAESEPVSRHVHQLSRSRNSPTFGLFLAPDIHPQTAEEFRGSRRYDKVTRTYMDVSIVPLTIGQFVAVFRNSQRRPTVHALLDHLESLAELRFRAKDGVAWLRDIAVAHKRWLDAVA